MNNNDTMFDNLDIVDGKPSAPRISVTVERILAISSALEDGYLNEVDIEKMRQPTVDMLIFLGDNVDVLNMSSETAELARLADAVRKINEVFRFGFDEDEDEDFEQEEGEF